jgi:hypothetical protein
MLFIRPNLERKRSGKLRYQCVNMPCALAMRC